MPASAEVRDLHDDGSMSGAGAMKAEDGEPVRKRISRACDQCNQLRTKCDGSHPCSHCQESGLTCEFNRERKKRGKAPKSDRRQSVGNSAGYVYSASTPAPGNVSPYDLHSDRDRDGRSVADSPYVASGANGVGAMNDRSSFSRPEMHNRGHSYVSDWHPVAPSPSTTAVPYPMMNANANDQYAMQPGAMPMGRIGTDSPADRIPNPGSFTSTVNPMQGGQIDGNTLRPAPHDHPNVGHLLAPHPAPHHHPLVNPQPNDFAMLNRMYGGARPSLTDMSPRSAPSSSSQFDRYAAQHGGRPPSSVHSGGSGSAPKYPILLPVLRELDFIPHAVLCDMLDTYFNNSPYVLAYVVRRRDFLHPTRPRRTTVGLLYAVLCVGAHTCENPFLSATPMSRAKAVQRLFELSVTALRPLQHDEVGGGCLDDVVTYLQLGTIIAASEFKGVSLRWLYSAWTLARELRLNREVPAIESAEMGETTREERRRTWWVLYMLDRHLCLCYNKPLVLTDVECGALFRPLDEDVWRSDERIDNDGDVDLHVSRALARLYDEDRRGPSYDVDGPGPFGFFLPLMVILGEVCAITFLSKQSAGIGFDPALIESAKGQVTRHLDRYAASLQRWNDPHVQPQRDLLTRPTVFSRGTFAPYATQLMHTMHILLCGKWDPIEMLENSAWISTREFLSATGHAVDAAASVDTILRIDPDLAFMPFFFGIYLLQGSFLLLLIVDKLEGEADGRVIDACETYIRAHEVCVVTLDTQYQRNFRRVLRSTLNSVRYRGAHTNEEEKTKRRELLTLYRWADDGRGLVI